MRTGMAGKVIHIYTGFKA